MRADRMRDFNSANHLVAVEGPPDHKQQCDGFEIWHYPSGVEDGMLYSIHVCVSDGRVAQAYSHMEPTDDFVPRPPPKWWQFWKRSPLKSV